jgi:hypothetical protein
MSFTIAPRPAPRRHHRIVELVSDVWVALLPILTIAFLSLLCAAYATPQIYASLGGHHG